MRRLISLLALVAFCSVRAQISWSPCTMPMNTLTVLTVGPYGEIVTLEPTNPAQPRISTDQGQSWQSFPGTGGPNGMLLSDQCLHVTNTGAILIWGTANGGSTYQVWRSADGGNTFASVGSGNGVPSGRFFFDFVSSPNGDVYLYGEGVLHSTDDGQNWASIVNASTMLDALTANSTTLYGARFSAIYRGALDGTGFTAINTSGAYVTDGRDLARGMNDRIIAVGGTDKVITTWDNGNLWYTANTGLGPVPAEWDHVAASLHTDRWVIGKQISVRFTDDAGATWITAETGLALAPNEPIQGIFCDSVGTFYLYGYFHLYRADIGTGMQAITSPEESRVFPNPTTGAVRLGDAFIGRALTVFDPAGREVMRTQVGYEGTLDLSGLESGQYLLRTADSGAAIPVQVEH